MSIEFARTHILSRSSGHSAIKAAAYRAGERLYDERTGLTADYSHRAADVRHAEVLLPEGSDPALLDRQTLWAAVETREDQHNRRASAQLAKDHILALPRELSAEDQIALARAFAASEFVSKGLVVDLAVHDHSEGNPHAHLLTTTRVLEGAEFGAKARDMNGKFFAGKRLPEAEQIRHRWAEFQNAWFLERGIDAHVHNHDGAGYAAEVHLGPTKAMTERGVETDLGAVNHEIRDARTRTLVENPSIVIDRVSGRKSLFSRHDLYREAAKFVDDPEAYRMLRAKLDAHPSLKTIRVAREGGVDELLTTQAVLDLELAIRAAGERLGEADSRFEIGGSVVGAALDDRPMLSEEQRAAALRLTESDRLGIVVGLAGAGKSTMLDAVRAAYTESGHRVQGLALAGKAADELSHSAGIESRTIASWLMSIEHGREAVEAGDVYVMDEAGMVDNRTMKRVLDVVEQGGAKLVLVGDGEQLQAIRAGCPFRDLARQEGYAEISTIRRQREDWMRSATGALARGDAPSAVAAYERAGFVHRSDRETSLERLVADYLAAPEASRTILAHRRVDVEKINERVRAARHAAGEIDIGRELRRGVPAADVLGTPIDLEAGDRIRFDVADPRRGIVAGERGTYLGEADGVHTVETDVGGRSSFTRDEYDGVRHAVDERRFLQRFAPGDRVLFTKNDKALGVKNGMLGELVEFDGAVARVRTDNGQVIAVDDRQYPHLEYGYATTIHKAQGMTVDRAFVLGSGTMDKHLGYVSMSRHRERLDVYLPDEQFERRSFASVISQARRQESALDLAREHGLETIAPPELARPARPIEVEPRRVEAPEPTEQIPSGPAAPALENGGPESVDRAELEREFEAASRRVDAAAAANLERIEQENRATLDRLDDAVQTARDELARHDVGEPRQGLFGSAAKHRTWSETRGDLERTVERATNASVRHRREAMEDPKQNEVLARGQALREHAGDAQALRRRGQVRAGESARALLERLETDRSRAPDTRERLAIDREIARVGETLSKNESYLSTLGRDQRRALERAQTRSVAALAREAGRGRGMDR